MKYARMLLLLCLLLYLPSTQVEAADFYVDSVGGDDDQNPGDSADAAWDSLNKAIHYANDGDTIYVIGYHSLTPTMYYPLDWDNPPAGVTCEPFFPLKKGVKILGGYNTNGDPANYAVTLSGEDPRSPNNSVAVPAVPASWSPYDATWWNHTGWRYNAVHVVEATDHTITDTTVLDGFTIEHGRGSIFGGATNAGGGINIRDCSPLIRNCTFQYNRGGNAGAAYVRGEYSSGGRYAEPKFEKCRFYRNYAFGGSSFAQPEPLPGDSARGKRDGNGGAVYCSRGSKGTQFIDCVFEENCAHRGGGALSIRCDREDGTYAANETMLYHCTFINNLTDNNASEVNDSPGGGAVQIAGDVEATLDYCKFYGNEARCTDSTIANAYGGAIWIGKYKRDDYAELPPNGPANRSEANSPRIENCVFANNKSAGSGGAIYIKSEVDLNEDGTYGIGGGPEIINCSFGGNTAEYYGGGLYSWIPPNSSAYTPDIQNCVFWSNKDTENSGSYNTDETAQIHRAQGLLAVVYTCVQGLNNLSGNNNIGDTPAEDNPNFPNLANSDIRLSGTTDCIDGGNNTYISADVNDYDNDGNTTETMPYDADFQEHSSQPLQMRIRGTVVDMGAYEYMQGDCNSNEIPDECDMACDPQDATDSCNMYPACGAMSCDVDNDGTLDVCQCVYDLDDSGFIGTGDENIIKANYGVCTSGPCKAYDLDCSDFIGTGDINIIKAHYGVCVD